MRVQNRKVQAWLRFFAAFLLCGLLLGLIFAGTFARYEYSLFKSFEFQYEAQNGQIYIRSVENEKTEVTDDVIPDDESMEGEVSGEILEDANVVDFIIANGSNEENYCIYDQEATLSLFATIGLENPENFIITLVDGNTTYLASCSEVVRGTDLYTTYGPGWIYHFYDSEGNEIKWLFPGTQIIERRMKLIVVGANDMPATLHLIAGAQPANT